MDHIDNYLATTIRDKSILDGLRGALALGKRTLNRYYTLTDSSDIYRIAMGNFFCELVQQPTNSSISITSSP